MRTLAWSSLAIFAAICMALFPHENRPTAGPLPLEDVRLMIKKNFAYNEELRLLSSVRGESPELSEATRNILTAVESFFASPDRPVRPAKTPSPVLEDLRRGQASFRDDLGGDPEEPLGRALHRSAEEYERGMDRKKFPADDAGDTLLERAYRRLAAVLPTAVEDRDRRKLALYMLGDIGTQLWTGDRDMAGVLCLIELIRMDPEDELAEMAWVRLNMQIHFGYTGSSGDHTPAEWKTFLKDLHEWIQNSHRH